jgi:hypothetical protein
MNTTLQSQLAPFAEECREQLSPPGAELAIPPTHEVSAQEKEIVTELARALKAWQTSADGRAKLQALKGMSLDEIRQELIALLQSDLFVPTLELITKPSLPILDYPIQTISIAVKFEADFVIFGFSGSLGVAVDPRTLVQAIKDKNPSGLDFSMFITGWVEEGIEAGAFVGVEAGVSGAKPSDLGGFAKGVEGSVVLIPDPLEDGLGVGPFAQYYQGVSRDGLKFEPVTGAWGVTVGIATGEDTALAFTESYTLVLEDITVPAIYQPTPPNGHMVIISILQCVNSNLDTDRVYFYFTPDGGTQYRYPTWDHRDMMEAKDPWDNQNTWYTGRSVKFTDSVAIELWSETDVGDDDSLGGLTFSYDSTWQVGTQIMLPQIKTNNGINDIVYNVWISLVY